VWAWELSGRDSEPPHIQIFEFDHTLIQSTSALEGNGEPLTMIFQLSIARRRAA
jgi:hypothetical protein